MCLFEDIQKNADKQIKNICYLIFFTYNKNLIIPTESKHFIDVVEANQVNMFLPFTEKNGVAGTIKEIRVRYPKEYFASMQQNPD